MKIPIYASEIEEFYDKVKESYPLAVAKRVSDFEIEFFSGNKVVATLTKEKVAKLDWNKGRDALSQYER